MAKLAALEAPQWEFLGRQKPLNLLLDDEAGMSRAVLDVRADYIFNRERVGVLRRVAFRMNDITAWYDPAKPPFWAVSRLLQRWSSGAVCRRRWPVPTPE